MKTIYKYPLRDYKVGGLYLVRKSSLVFQIEILATSEKALKIRWESGNSSWVLKEDFYFDYSFVEQLNKGNPDSN